MIGIESDDPALERCLRKLERRVVAAGGWLNEALTIVAEDGALRVETRLGRGNHELLLSMPQDVLLPIDSIDLQLSGDDLCIASFKTGVSRVRRELFENMIEIYNLTEKIETHRKRAPKFALAKDAETLKYLSRGREAGETGAESSDQAVIQDFLHSRMLDFEGGKQASDRQDVLMPFNELLNHHTRAATFQGAAEADATMPGISVVNSKPVPDSRECFVRYGIFDTYDLLSVYGFVAKDCPFIRSLPLTIDLEGVGKITANSVPGWQFNRELPPEAPDLGFYMPMAATTEPGKLRLSHLIIPGPRAPHALQRILAGFIAMLKPELGKTGLLENVKEAERQILSENGAFYDGLRTRVRAARAGGATEEIYAMAGEMAELQLERLGSYEPLE